MSLFKSFIALTAISLTSHAAELPYDIKETEVLVSNDFSKDNLKEKPWSIRFGTWHVKNGALSSEQIASQNHSSSMSLFYKISNETMFSCDFTLGEKGKGFRVALFGKGGCKLMIHSHEMYLILNDKQDKDNGPDFIDWKKVDFKPGQKYHLDFAVKGDTTVVLIDGKVMMAGKHPILKNDNKKRYQFSTSNPKHTLDNFKLSNITMNLESIPKDKFRDKHWSIEEFGKLPARKELAKKEN